MTERNKELQEIIDDMKYTANKNNLVFDALLLSKAYRNSYRSKYFFQLKETDYIIEQMNCQLEVMIEFYGKKGRYGR